MKKFYTILIIFAVLLGLILALFAMLLYLITPRQYITSDIQDYGHYIGNFDNKSVQEFISSFFPEEIESYFADITYSYRAQKNDAYAFEAYLQFRIEDTDRYTAFIEEHTKQMSYSTFCYDDTYDEYVLIDEFVPTQSASQQPNNPDAKIHILNAKIGKILCSSSKQEIIFVALGVYDGGIVTTDFLTVYFNRFKIDPSEYAEKTGDGSQDRGRFSVLTCCSICVMLKQGDYYAKTSTKKS